MTMMPVHIVDDDPEMVASVRFLLRAEGVPCTSHDSAEALLDALPSLDRGCILLDLKLGGMSGLELQRELHARGCDLPVVIMTGHGDVSSAVAAMKEGAIDFIQKPFAKAELVTAIEAAWKRAVGPTGSGERDKAIALVETLSPRERQVLAGLVHGKANKIIAHELSISPRTIEIHRAHAMRKLKAKSLPEMLHTAFLAGVMDG
jgi:two-component system, LuxR family, response regulator FixJ